MKYYQLPNALNFAAMKLGENKIAALFGIKKAERVIEIQKDREISIANSYLNKQYRRLEKYKKDKQVQKYEKLSLTLIQKSVIYRLALFNHKNSRWYYIGKGKVQKRLFEKVGQLVADLSTKVDISRVYIPKKPNSPDRFGRPLGVPKMEWRIVPAMILNFMQGWVKGISFQHGGMPRKGTKTFIEDLLMKDVVHKNFIWEFDYKGMFNNISHESILKHMEELGIPNKYIEWSKEVLKVKPSRFQLCTYNRNEDQPLLHYEKEMVKLGETLFSNYMEVIKTNMKELRELLPRNPEDLFKEGVLTLPRGIEDIFSGTGIPGLDKGEETEEKKIKVKALKILALVEDQKSRGTYPEKMGDMMMKEIMNNLEYTDKGVPQGLGPSPFWSCLVTRELEEIKNNILMYMDDGILYSDTKEEMEEIQQKFREGSKRIGVEINESKSGYVKYEGEYLKPLKIIGVKYSEKEFQSSTNKGTIKDLCKLDLEKTLKAIKAGEISRESIKIGSGQEDHIIMERFSHDQQLKILIKYGLFGVALSKAWNPSKITEDDFAEERLRIEEGMDRVIESIEKNRKSYCVTTGCIGNGLGNPYGKYAALQTISTKAVRNFLKYLKNKSKYSKMSISANGMNKRRNK